jgi:hypothetical protein
MAIEIRLLVLFCERHKVEHNILSTRFTITDGRVVYGATPVSPNPKLKSG